MPSVLAQREAMIGFFAFSRFVFRPMMISRSTKG